MKTILVLTDFSAAADHAAGVALGIAERTGSDLLLFHLFSVPAIIPAESGVYPYYSEYTTIENEVAERLEKAAGDLRARAGSPVEIGVASRPFALGNQVLEPVDRSRTWLIVMGDRATGRTATHLIRGRFTTDIIEKAFCPVLLVPESLGLSGNFSIAFADNLEPREDQALAQAAEFAAVFGSEILVIHISRTKVPEPERLRHHSGISQITGNFRYLATDYEDLESDQIAESLAEFAQNADVRVLALVHNRYSFFHRLFESRHTRETLNYGHAMLLVLPQASQ